MHGSEKPLSNIRYWYRLFDVSYLPVSEDGSVVALHDPFYEVIAGLFIESLLLSALVVYCIKGEVFRPLLRPARVANRNLG